MACGKGQNLLVGCGDKGTECSEPTTDDSLESATGARAVESSVEQDGEFPNGFARYQFRKRGNRSPRL